MDKHKQPSDGDTKVPVVLRKNSSAVSAYAVLGLSALSDVICQTGFTSTHQVIELHGHCISCRDKVAS